MKHRKQPRFDAMIFVKLILTALVCAPLCVGVYLLVGDLLHLPRTGHVDGESIEVKILSKSPQGISTPPMEWLIAPIATAGENLLKGALDSLLVAEASKYRQTYMSRLIRDDFYISGGPLSNPKRLESTVDEADERYNALKEDHASERDIQDFHDELDVAKAHLATFNPNNECSIGIIRVIRSIRYKGVTQVACTIEVVPVSNESGTLLKFRLWKLRVDYAKSLVNRWYGRLDLDIGLRIVGVESSNGGQFVESGLLEDVIEIRGVEIGRTYSSEELTNQETVWFPYPARIEYEVGFNEGAGNPEIRQDFGNYSLTVAIVEKGY